MKSCKKPTNRIKTPAAFQELFIEGMTLVENASACVNCTGECANDPSNSSDSTANHTINKKIMTAATQLASWLLLQLAVYEGDMTKEQAMIEQNKSLTHELISEIAVNALPLKELHLLQRITTLNSKILEYATGTQRNICTIQPLNQSPENSQLVDNRDNYVAMQLDKIRSIFETVRRS